MKLLRKLKSNRGESLAETLLALLVVAFSAVILFSMTGSAAKITGQTKGYYSDTFEDISAIAVPETGAGITKDSNFLVTVKGENSTVITVNSYIGESGILCYRNK